jgi:transposase-like protein
MARPTKLTPEIQEKICRLIASTGCTVEGAAAAVDLDARTIYDWRSRGLVEQSGRFHQFSQALMRARAKSEATLVASIATAAKGDWRAAAWLLERRFPDQYGNRLTLIKRLEQMTEDELDAYLAERLESAGLPDEAGAGDQAAAAAEPAAAASADTEP